MGVQPIAVPQTLAYMLTSAGDRNGVDFDYLLQTAMRESSLNPQARAQSSSAVGLFQFLESTWLQVMKEQGPRLGYQQYADAIQKTGDGYQVADPQVKAQILKLREDPQIAADLAAAFTKSNGDYLSAKFGRQPSAGELYIAHFLGAQGAEKMFNAGLQNPDQVAADLFPRQAQANRTIFYDNGQPRTIRQVYRALVSQHETGVPSVEFATQQLASQPAVPPPPMIPSRFSPANMSFTGLFKNEQQAQPQSPLEPVAAGGSAFFTQLYGQ
ncbi:MAG: transglycosylase SLT domain-containing protein [Devosia sp.]